MCICIKRNRQDKAKMFELAQKYSLMEKKDVQFYYTDIIDVRLYDFATAAGRLHPNCIELIKYEP